MVRGCRLSWECWMILARIPYEKLWLRKPKTCGSSSKLGNTFLMLVSIKMNYSSVSMGTSKNAYDFALVCNTYCGYTQHKGKKLDV